MQEKDSVVLVDSSGNTLFNHDGTLSTMHKMEAHRHGSLHRAISVFIFNNRNELLLQKRAQGKYHSPGKWTNTCCTHPYPGEIPIICAQRRLSEEMGLAARLTEAFSFSYKADVGNGLIENEFDHVFMGVSNQNPRPDPAEVSDWMWETLESLEQKLLVSPESYSAWLRKCFREVVRFKTRNSVIP
jgi:isopentenyl-diphosphate delta-isomerase